MCRDIDGDEPDLRKPVGGINLIVSSRYSLESVISIRVDLGLPNDATLEFLPDNLSVRLFQTGIQQRLRIAKSLYLLSVIRYVPFYSGQSSA